MSFLLTTLETEHPKNEATKKSYIRKVTIFSTLCLQFDMLPRYAAWVFSMYGDELWSLIIGYGGVRTEKSLVLPDSRTTSKAAFANNLGERIAV